MNLQELHESKKTKVVRRALREHYEINIDFDNLDMVKAQRMLAKTKALIKESKIAGAANNSGNNPTYIKLLMVEQGLQDRINDLKNPNMRVVVENEEIQKSQVILAAQDMVDSLQKMLEDVSKMNVEELNAVVEGMRNEFGSSEADQFNASVGEALSGLQDAVTNTKQAVQGALGVITGTGSDIVPTVPDMGGELPTGVEQETDMDISGEEEIEPEIEPEIEEPESVDVAQAGRERR